MRDAVVAIARLPIPGGCVDVDAGRPYSFGPAPREGWSLLRTGSHEFVLRMPESEARHLLEDARFDAWLEHGGPAPQ